ncbi:DEAD/DEAH box helicase [Paenibacillus illinoisensis]|uniref:DEAD/DEAH box helicase n=1 Tax=Paenibacillus illinoisensis TaxID=59845 RepID=UPI003CED72D4
MSTTFINLMKKYEFPDEIIEVWDKSNIKDLLPIQSEAISRGLFSQKNFLIVAPTSSGKTFVGEMAAINYTYNGKKSIYLVPFKAVAEEKYDDFCTKYSSLGIDIKISDRDHRENDDDIRTGHYDIAILTYEKLSGMLIINPDLLSNCDCIVVDEVQMLGDPQRGGNLELLLTKIREFSHLQIIALSAVLDDLNGFDTWLDAEVIKENTRPVELRQGIFNTGNGTFEYKEWNTGTAGAESIAATDMNGLIRYLLDCGEQIVIIKNSVPSTQKLAVELMNEFYVLPAASKTIGELRDEPESETRDELLTVLRNSIAFHNADCELAERRAVERGFKAGEIKILVATTTLSAGVNLPCKTVILADDKKWGQGRSGPQPVNWSVSEVRNIFGRAGRLLDGQNDFGRGIFIASTSRDKETLKRVYLNAPLESLSSALADQNIDRRVLDVVASGFGNNEAEIISFIFKTYAAQSWNSDHTKEQIISYIKAGIQKCLEYELFEVSSSGIQITELGKICASLGCSIESVSIIEDYLTSAETLDSLEILFASSQTKEVYDTFYRGVNWNSSEFRKKIMGRLDELADTSLLSGICLNEYEKAKSKGFFSTQQFKAFVCALLSFDIINTNESIAHIKRAYGFSTANIRNITLNISWMLEVASRSSTILHPNFTEDIDKINIALIKCSPLSCNHLNSLKIQLTREEKLRLVDKGYKTLDDFLDKESSDFKGIINPKKVDQIIQSIYTNRERNLDYWEADHVRRIDKLTGNTDLLKEVYSAQGLNFEHIVLEFLNIGFLTCHSDRITSQRKGEPDILLYLDGGEKAVIQVTSKEDKTKVVDQRKALEVLVQSEKLTPNIYICLAKPDFHALAIESAIQHARKTNFKLITITCLVELYIRVLEEDLSKEQATAFIQNEKGYLDIKALNRFISNLKISLK